MLVPGQSQAVLGTEILALGLVIAAILLTRRLRLPRGQDDPRCRSLVWPANSTLSQAHRDRKIPLTRELRQVVAADMAESWQAQANRRLLRGHQPAATFCRASSLAASAQKASGSSMDFL